MVRFAIVLGFLSLVSTSWALNVEPIRRYNLPNGLTIITKVDKRAELIGVHTFVNSGWVGDPKASQGLTNLLMEMLSRGRGDEDTFSLEFGCERELSFIRSEALPEHLSAVIGRHGELLLEPNFTSQQFLACRAEAVKRVRSFKNNPYVDGYLESKFRTLLYGKSHPYAKNRMGTEESLRSVDLSLLKNHHRALLKGNKLTIVIVGNFAVESAKSLVQKHFGPLPAEKNPQKIHKIERCKFSTPRELRLGIEGLTKSSVYLGFKGPSMTHEDIYPMVLIEALLTSGQGGMLRKSLCERGDISRVTVSFDRALQSCDFRIAFESSSPRIDWAVAQVLEELSKLKSILLDESQLALLRRKVKNGYLFETPRTVVLSYLLGRYESLSRYELYQDFFAHLDEVTASDVQRVARKYFDLSDYALFVLRPAGTLVDEEQEYAEKTLKNGLRVIVKPDYGNSMIGLSIGLKVGPWLDPNGKEGLCQLLFQILADGSTRKRSVYGLRKSIEDIGAILQCPCANDSSALLGLTSTHFFDETLHHFFELYKEPLLNERTRVLALEHVKESKKATEANSVVNLGERVLKIFHGVGRQSAFDRVKLKDLSTFHELFFTPENTVVVIVGDISPKAVFSLVEGTFGSLPKEKAKLVVPNPISKQPTATQTHFSSASQQSFGLALAAKDSFADYAALSVLTTILGRGKDSVLAKDLKKAGFSPVGLNAFVRFYGSRATAVFCGALEGKSVKLLPPQLSKLIRKALSAPLSDQEVKKSTERLVLAMARQHESCLQQAYSIFWCKLYAPSPMFFHELPHLYRSVRKRNVVQVAQKLNFTHHLLLVGH